MTGPVVPGTQRPDRAAPLVRVGIVADDPSTAARLLHAVQQAGQVAVVVPPAAAHEHAGLELLVVSAGTLGPDGAARLRRLVATGAPPIVVVLAPGAPHRGLLAAGAVAIVDLEDAELLPAQLRALAGARTPAEAVAVTVTWAGFEADLGRCSVAYHGRALRLSTVQFRVLAALLAAEGSVVSAAALERAVRRTADDAAAPHPSRIPALVRRLRRALDEQQVPPGLIRSVPEAGYRLAPADGA